METLNNQKAIQHRIAAEKTKVMYRKIRNCRENPKAGITRLDVPEDPENRDYGNCTSWITIDKPQEIEERFFGQADSTFPTKPPFSEWVDWGASNHTSELILEEGNWTSPEIDEMTQLLINPMNKRVELDSIPAELSHSYWIEKIKPWPETATTSPSGFHLGHSKGLVSPHDLEPTAPSLGCPNASTNTVPSFQSTVLQSGALSLAYFSTHESAAHGASFELPDGKLKTRVYMIRYVDDTNVGSIDGVNKTEHLPYDRKNVPRSMPTGA